MKVSADSGYQGGDGAIIHAQSTELRVTNSDFKSNKAARGAAIDCVGCAVYISNCNFLVINNKSTFLKSESVRILDCRDFNVCNWDRRFSSSILHSCETSVNDT